MSRVLRQIFKKIFCGDLFRPAAIFFCAPAAALTPSRTVCAPLPSPADACALLVSFPAVLYSRPAPPDFSPARSLLSCSLCLLLLAGPVQTSLFPEQSACPFLLPCTHTTRTHFFSPMLFFILSRARTSCAFFYCCANISRARSYSVVRRHAADNMITRTCPAHFYSFISRYASKDLTTRLRPARLKREDAPERGALSSYR